MSATAELTQEPEVTEAHATVPADLPVIEMVSPMAGFPDHHRFALVRLDEDGLLCALQSVEDQHLRFLVVPPYAFFPDYAPEVDDSVAELLATGSGAVGRGDSGVADVMALVVVNPGQGPGGATANLLAPVLVNTASRRGVQVVLDEELPVRAPLPLG